MTTLADIQHLRGSPHRDSWRWARKQLTDKSHWGTDGDFFIISRVVIERQRTYRATGGYDIKHPGQRLTFTEIAAYQTWIEAGLDVFIVEYYMAELPKRKEWDWSIDQHSEFGRHNIIRFIEGDPGPPTWEREKEDAGLSWARLDEWETDYIASRNEW